MLYSWSFEIAEEVSCFGVMLEDTVIVVRTAIWEDELICKAVPLDKC